MATAENLVEIWRGDMCESVHQGHAVICDDTGQVIASWGDPNVVMYPRSSSKMIQALPLIESGAAAAFGLKTHQLALACASHQGAAIHTDPVGEWLGNLGLKDSDFRCGPQEPNDRSAMEDLIRAGKKPCQIHNNCSGKHTGFLTLNKHLGGPADYELIDHPMQKIIKATFEDVTNETSPGFGIDGCSAPNHSCSLAGFASAMARFATAADRSDRRSNAMVQLIDAMRAFPELVAGEGRACTNLMRATNGQAAIKGGAEGYYAAILPGLKLGIAVKAADGASRASECIMASLLVRLGVLDPAHPAAARYHIADVKNWRGIVTGQMRPAATLMQGT